MERHAWMSAHNMLGLLFVAFSLWHAMLNRQALKKHLWSTVSSFPSITREVLLAGAAVCAILALFIGHAFHAG